MAKYIYYISIFIVIEVAYYLYPEGTYFYKRIKGLVSVLLSKCCEDKGPDRYKKIGLYIHSKGHSDYNFEKYCTDFDGIHSKNNLKV